ncbi:MAG: deoxyribose-phosphate aldolase [Geitlerinemataceae cyanobacterium]
MARNTIAEIDLAPTIDHALLNPLAHETFVRQWCSEAERFGFASVCVYPNHVRLAAECLQGKAPIVSTVIGYPTGTTTASVKRYEALEAVDNGASELGVTLDLAQLKAGKTNQVHRAIAEICEDANVPVKAIVETNLLEPDELAVAVDLCIDAGATHIVTGTGWNGGVTIEAVCRLKDLAKGRIAIEAAAGIRDMHFAIDLLVAGATRLGTSYAMAMLQQRERERQEARLAAEGSAAGG